MDIRSLFRNGLRVLVGDIDESLCDLVQKLESFHYEVIACSEAASALNILKVAKERVDLIITEVQLPKLDGFLFLNSVKELNIPVIMMSCSTQHELAIKCFAAGATFYYRKPIDIECVSGMWKHVPLTRLFALSMRVNKIQEDKSDEEEENSDRQENEGDTERKKVIWTNEMHLEFIHAVDIVGVTRATPAKVLKLLDRKGLGKKHVASHLQKYRDHMKGKNRDTYRRNILWSGETMYEKPSIFDSGPKEMIDRHKAELRMQENLEDLNTMGQEEDESQTLPEAFRDHKKRKREETQKSIKSTVGDTVQEKSSTIDSKPEGMVNNNVSETRMIDNETTSTTSVPPTNEADTQMYCNQRKDEISDGHNRRQQSIGETILEHPFVLSVEPEDMINTDMVKIWGLNNELIQNINVPEACMSDNQSGEISYARTSFEQQTRILPQGMTEYSSEFDTMMLDVERLGNIEGNYLTLESHDSNPVENSRDYTNLMSYDSFEEILWTEQGREVMDEHILQQNLASGNNYVSLQYHNGIEPDDNLHSMPERTSSVNANEQQALQGIENLQMISDKGSNNEYYFASGANEETLELPEEISLETFWDILFDEK